LKVSQVDARLNPIDAISAISARRPSKMLI
jgi:hypothetical protein